MPEIYGLTLVINWYYMKYIGKIFLIVVVLACTKSASAQLKGFGIGPYVEMGWPAGDFQDTHKNGIGAGLSADIKLPGRLGITGSAGIMHFGGKTFNDGKVDAINAIPIRAGLKFRPLPLIYFKVEAGTAHFTSNEKGSAFLLSPGIGVRILGIDIQGKYETWFKNGNYSFWGIRAGLNL